MRAARLVAALEATGDIYTLIELRTVALECRLARGEQGTRAEADWLVETARIIGTVDIIAMAHASAAAALAADAPDDACAVLAELERTRESPYYGRHLAGMVRAALAAGDPVLAKRLADVLEPRHPFNEYALRSARAQIAEHAGEHAEAARLYAEAAERWKEFGNVPESAHALLGQGRCLLKGGRPRAEEPLRKARDLFAAMGYEPALAETEALLRDMAAV